jgi:hypothetical protein
MTVLVGGLAACAAAIKAISAKFSALFFVPAAECHKVELRLRGPRDHWPLRRARS